MYVNGPFSLDAHNFVLKHKWRFTSLFALLVLAENAHTRAQWLVPYLVRFSEKQSVILHNPPVSGPIFLVEDHTRDAEARAMKQDSLGCLERPVLPNSEPHLFISTGIVPGEKSHASTKYVHL